MLMKKFSVWDLLTILTLVATITLGTVFWSIFTNPGSALNPFPNPTTIPTIVMPTLPATIIIIDTATSTESATVTITATATETMTETPTPSATNTVTGTISITTTPTTSSTPTKTITATRTGTPALTRTATRTSTVTKTGLITQTASATKAITSTSTTVPTNTATLMAVASLTPTATIAILPTLTFTPAPTSGSGCDGGNTSIESAVLSGVNYQREQAGVAPLQASSALFSAARGHSQDMATNNFFSHTGSNGSSPFDRISSAGFSYSAAAENIYAGNGSYNSASSAVGWWMGSDGHRENMLNPTYTYAGVGYWCNSNSEYGGYFTLDLARP